MFGTSSVKPLSFGSSSTNLNLNNPPQQSAGLFGNSTQQQSNNNPFGQSTQPQQTNFSFGAAGQTQQGGFGQSIQQQQPQQQSQSQFKPFGITLQYGNNQGTNHQSSGLLQQTNSISPYRSVPSQLQAVQAKWNPNDFTSPFRTYLFYNVEKEEEAVKFQPEPIDDIREWEKAVERRPGPTYVPRLFKGFEGLADRAKLQQKFLMECHEKLVQINNSLEVQLDRHRQFIASRLSESRRRHERISKRTLALAVKTQILRNKGYVMDNAEEEIKEKLAKLEREVMDQSLNGREQEIWARMLEIRERVKRIKQEMEKLEPQVNGNGPMLSEEIVAKAKKVSAAGVTHKYPY